MNKTRRNFLGKLVKELYELEDSVTDLVSKLELAKIDIEGVKDEEQEAFDNLPESLQSGDKGATVQAAIDELESAADEVQNIIDALDNVTFGGAIVSLESAAE